VAVALVSHAGWLGTSATSGTFTSAAINTTGATLLVMTVVCYGGNFAGVSVSDSKGNTWTGLTKQSNATGAYTRLYYVNSATPTVGTSHTFSIVITSQNYPAGQVAAFSGVLATTTPIQNGHAQTTASTNLPGSVTSVTNGSLIISGLGADGTGISAYAIDSGFTITDFNLNVAGTYWGSALAYLIQGTAGAISPTWTFTGTVVDTSTTIAVFAPIVVAAQTPYQPWYQRAPILAQ